MFFLVEDRSSENYILLQTHKDKEMHKDQSP